MSSLKQNVCSKRKGEIEVNGKKMKIVTNNMDR